MKLSNNNFNLILSGGAALGYAHIGVCEYLEEFKIKPKSYHGVSMGAIVASVEALTLSREEKNSIYTQISDIFKWLSFNLTSSLISIKKIEKMVSAIFGSMDFNDLETELFIGATDYKTGDFVSFSKKNNILIKDALLASMAVPGVFPPRTIKEGVYVDGYISSNLPLASVENNLPNLVVNVTGKNSFKELSSSKLLDLSLLKNLERSIRILIYNQTKMALNFWDKEYILIEPKLFDYKTTHFYKFSQIKEKGYEEAKKILL